MSLSWVVATYRGNRGAREDLGDWRIETTKAEIDSFLNRLEIVGSTDKVKALEALKTCSF
jgi:hypothetical protein